MSNQLLEKATKRFIAEKKQEPQEAGFNVFCKINNGLAIFAVSQKEANAFQKHQTLLKLLLLSIPVVFAFLILLFLAWIIFVLPLSGNQFWIWTLATFVFFVLPFIAYRYVLNKYKELEKIFSDKVYLCALD